MLKKILFILLILLIILTFKETLDNTFYLNSNEKECCMVEKK